MTRRPAIELADAIARREVSAADVVAATSRCWSGPREDGSIAGRPTGDGMTLEELLGAAPPAGVAALPEADRASLVALIRAARRRQSEDLAAAFDATLRHIPFPLRGVVKKVLVG
ncbi:MAG: hypothetical protein ACRDVG_05995 [Jatrophihabitantaceae bacterium]